MRWLRVIVRAFGVKPAALALDLQRVLWRVWALVTFVWVTCWLTVLAFSPERRPVAWLLALTFLPPVLLLLLGERISGPLGRMLSELDAERASGERARR